MIYWPVLLKAIRLLGDSTQQGRLFGFLEAGRGVIDTIVAFSALGIFLLLGSGAGGLKAAILFYSACVIIAGILAYFLLEDDKINTQDEQGNEISKNKVAWNGVVKAVKTPEILVVSFNYLLLFILYIVV